MKTDQVFLARTAALRQVGWSEQLRMVDHTDFFVRASGRMVFVQDTESGVYHARTPFNRRYMAFRDDVAADFDFLAEHGFGFGAPRALTDD